ncbi:MAG: tetratricopeptide repeat protein, partial [Sphingomonadales bacterium]|nr:tetratricopeptide repeat protein [Sphingomonadales bacterium]
ARIRAQEANIAYFEGQLAARRGDFATAMAKAKRNAELVDPDPNPRKLEPYHDLMGLIALRQGEFAKAVEHYEQANPGFMYSRYHLALALEGAGEAERAQALFREVGEWNFNSVGFALVRRDALSKAGEV